MPWDRLGKSIPPGRLSSRQRRSSAGRLLMLWCMRWVGVPCVGQRAAGGCGRAKRFCPGPPSRFRLERDRWNEYGGEQPQWRDKTPRAHVCQRRAIQGVRCAIFKHIFHTHIFTSGVSFLLVPSNFCRAGSDPRRLTRTVRCRYYTSWTPTHVLLLDCPGTLHFLLLDCSGILHSGGPPARPQPDRAAAPTPSFARIPEHRERQSEHPTHLQVMRLCCYAAGQ